MFIYKTDTTKNIIEIRMEGTLSDLDIAKAANKIKVEFKTLAPGFTVIADISKLETNDKMYAPLLREVMEMLGKNNPGKVIRIVSDKLLAEKFRLAWDNEFVNYEVIVVESYEEALASLNQ